MNYGTVCSGIEACSVAWEPLGWNPQFFSEIESFPKALLKHHYPSVPDLGDMNNIVKDGKINSPIDLICGGTPCQSFSVAGLRKGLDDPRGNLALVFLGIVEATRPTWVLWENVPGVLSSNGGRDFGAFIGALAKLGYGFAYRVLDAQFFGIPQRRRRVFVVGHISDHRRAAAVLFERKSLSWDSEKSRKKRQKAAGGSTQSIAKCLAAKAAGGQNLDSEMSTFIYPTLDTNTNAKYRGNQWVDAGCAILHAPLMAQSSNCTVDSINEETTRWISEGTRPRRIMPIEAERLQGFPDHYTLIDYSSRASRKKINQDVYKFYIRNGMDHEAAVRAAKHPDSPRYKALGNSMAVPVMKWIGQRIDIVNQIPF